MDLQVRNLEESINNSFEKSFKIIEKTKETDNNQRLSENVMKALEKIKETMKVYNAEGTSMHKEMSKSQFSKLVPNRKSLAGTETISKKNSTSNPLDIERGEN